MIVTKFPRTIAYTSRLWVHLMVTNHQRDVAAQKWHLPIKNSPQGNTPCKLPFYSTCNVLINFWRALKTSSLRLTNNGKISAKLEWSNNTCSFFYFRVQNAVFRTCCRYAFYVSLYTPWSCSLYLANHFSVTLNLQYATTCCLSFGFSVYFYQSLVQGTSIFCFLCVNCFCCSFACN